MENQVQKNGQWNRGRPNKYKDQKLPPEPLTKAEVLMLLNQCDESEPIGLRNRALLTVLWRSGVRISEALSLRPCDLDPAAGSLNVLRGKGRKQRVVGIDYPAIAIVQNWLSVRNDFANDEGPLFCTLKGRRLQTAYARSLVKRLARKAGIAKRVHPHGLRHSFAADLRKEVRDIGLISRQLGHADLRTTIGYLARISPEDVLEAIRNRTW